MTSKGLKRTLLKVTWRGPLKASSGAFKFGAQALISPTMVLLDELAWEPSKARQGGLKGAHKAMEGLRGLMIYNAFKASKGLIRCLRDLRMLIEGLIRSLKPLRAL